MNLLRWTPRPKKYLRHLAALATTAHAELQQQQPQQYLELLGQQYVRDRWTNVTPTIAAKLAMQLHTRPGHPLCTIRKLIENHFHDYSHFSSLSPIVSPFKNFDELCFPHDHPGRALSDSYYVNKEYMLRTHTSAHEVEVFRAGESKWLLTADVYRRDEIDGSHYPVFHQMEGARIFDANSSGMKDIELLNQALSQSLASSNLIVEDVADVSASNPAQEQHDPHLSALVAKNLKLSVTTLLYALFGGKSSASPSSDPLRVRWVETYFPFTSPSFEVEIFWGGKWLEVLGSGVVIHSTLDTAGISGKIGWAFGLGLERLAMILFSIPDIRLFWSTDARFLSQFRENEITSFKPYSKYPACFKDLSFWESGDMPPLHDNDFCDLIRDVAGDLVEQVTLIDKFQHPKTGKTSLCYRINYRSMDKSLSNEETNAIHNQVVNRVTAQFGVEIR